MTSEYGQRLGVRLRLTRTAQGLSLAAVEEKSGGRWKAAVIGSYERASRRITVECLAELAGLYGVSLPSLVPDAAEADETRAEVGHLTRIVTNAGINNVAQAQRVALAILGDGYARDGAA